MSSSAVREFATDALPDVMTAQNLVSIDNDMPSEAEEAQGEARAPASGDESTEDEDKPGRRCMHSKGC